jgi:hypothetical protein
MRKLCSTDDKTPLDVFWQHWQDVISLVIQGVGGGLASNEAAEGTNARLVSEPFCIPQRLSPLLISIYIK